MVFLSSKNVTSTLCALLLLSLQRIIRVVGQSVVMDWNQIGSDINGESLYDQFGRSVVISADGKTIAVGAFENFVFGYVRVYKSNDTSSQYTQYAPDITASGNLFGRSLAISADGNTIAAGAPWNGRGSNGTGSVRIFRVNTTQSSVVQYQQIGSDILGEAEGDFFGDSIAMSADGNTFVAGARANNVSGSFSGHARVFKLDASSPKGYTQIGPDLDGTAASESFGGSLAMSTDGKIVAVGGTGNSDAGYTAGVVRVYKSDPDGTQYNQIGTDIYGESPGDYSGGSLAMSADGSTIAVGATGNDGKRSKAGHVRVYKIDSLGKEYIQFGFDIDGEASGDYSGDSVAMSDDGTTIAVGSVYNDGNGFGAGHVRVYQLDLGAGQYKQIGTDIDGKEAYDYSSSSLGMSSDGTLIVVGANNKGNGHVRVFRYSPVPFSSAPTRTPTRVGDWNQVGSDIDGEDEYDYSGSSVAMSADGKTIAVGSTVGGGASNAGHARVYKMNDTSDQYTQFGPDIDGKESSDFFGWSMAMSVDGNTIAVGALENSGDRIGYVQMFRADTTQSSVVQYRQIGSDILGEAVDDGSGGSVAISADGNTIVVGAIGNSGNGIYAGHARVFKLDASSPKGYRQIGPDLDGKGRGDGFGDSVTISADGSRVAVSGRGNDDRGLGNGYVRFYILDAKGTQYNKIGADIYGEASGDLFGGSLVMSADGTTVAVGAVRNDGIGVDAGHVRVYKLDSLGQNYTSIGLDIDGEAAGDLFGYSVAISDDGSTIAVGAIYNDGNGSEYGGHVRVYKLDPAVGQYRQIGTDINGEGADDQFGISLDMSSDGTMIVVGATSNRGVNGANSGHVRVFRYVSSPTPPSPPVKIPSKLPTKPPSPPPTACGLFCSIRKFLCRIFRFC